MKENESLNMFFAMGVFNVQRCKTTFPGRRLTEWSTPYRVVDALPSGRRLTEWSTPYRVVDWATRDYQSPKSPIPDLSSMHSNQSTESPILFRSCEHETPFSDQNDASKIGDSVLWFKRRFLPVWASLNRGFRGLATTKCAMSTKHRNVSTLLLSKSTSHIP